MVTAPSFDTAAMSAMPVAVERPAMQPTAMPLIEPASSRALPEQLLGTKALEFLTDPASPFADKYSVDRERVFLDEFIRKGGGEDEAHPLYDRYLELLDRQERLAKMKGADPSSMAADTVVEHNEAVGMRSLGRLVDDDVDQMEVHTLEGYRMFLGRRREPGSQAAPIIGGKRMASVLRSLWMMTGQDNPYADWALVRHEHSIAEVAARLDREIAAAEAAIEHQRKRGVHLSILRNPEPARLSLGFRSPYGFGVAKLINNFDCFVRMQKTLERKDLRSDEQVRQSIQEITRLIRRVWQDTSRFDRWLSREEVRTLGRADFVEPAPEEAARRLAFATEVFGAVPSQIFTCTIQPKHSRRHRRISAEEAQLLERIGAKLAQAEVAESEAQEAAAREAGAA